LESRVKPPKHYGDDWRGFIELSVRGAVKPDDERDAEAIATTLEPELRKTVERLSSPFLPSLWGRESPAVAALLDPHSSTWKAMAWLDTANEALRGVSTPEEPVASVPAVKPVVVKYPPPDPDRLEREERVVSSVEATVVALSALGADQAQSRAALVAMAQDQRNGRWRERILAVVVIAGLAVSLAAWLHPASSEVKVVTVTAPSSSAP